MVACGNVYPNRLDDVAWENDKAGYRAYGPALQRTGEKAYGYDVFTKSVAYPVLERRYQMETSSEILSRISELRKQGKKNEADSLRNATSYHVDHGNGMDCYNVGPTLGGGTAALLHGTDIIYPYCYQHVEILDNGPLRFCMRLRYHPFSLAADSGVVETRKITLDAGSHLNKTEVIYNRLSKPTGIVAGIVLHPQNPDGYFYNTEKGILVYADSTNNKRNNNGVIYVGLVFGQYPDSTGVRWFDDAEKKKRPGALGHVLGYGTYYPGTAYTYYWGSGWSKSGIRIQFYPGKDGKPVRYPYGRSKSRRRSGLHGRYYRICRAIGQPHQCRRRIEKAGSRPEIPGRIPAERAEKVRQREVRKQSACQCD